MSTYSQAEVLNLLKSSRKSFNPEELKSMIDHILDIDLSERTAIAKAIDALAFKKMLTEELIEKLLERKDWLITATLVRYANTYKSVFSDKKLDYIFLNHKRSETHKAVFDAMSARGKLDLDAIEHFFKGTGDPGRKHLIELAFKQYANNKYTLSAIFSKYCGYKFLYPFFINAMNEGKIQPNLAYVKSASSRKDCMKAANNILSKYASSLV